MAARKMKVDKDLKKIGEVQAVSRTALGLELRIGLSIGFLLLVFGYVALTQGVSATSLIVVVAAVVGGYMAMTIGANDVANNVGPAVGSRAITMAGALVIAAIFEATGALVAGSDVVATVSGGIVDPARMPGSRIFVEAMLAALLAAALWIHLATYLRAPVSTTHSIVGAVLGAGASAAGMAVINWPVVGKITASWVISPIMGGVIAAALLAFIKFTVLYRPDKIAAARTWVPVLSAVTAATFITYLLFKGLKHLWTPSVLLLALIASVIFMVVYGVTRYRVGEAAFHLENTRKGVARLFTMPLIFAAAILSFAHGANDVANAVGPLSAIAGIVGQNEIGANVSVPYWVLVVGGIGIAIGLGLFGPRLIRMVGEQITKLNPIRAFCVALAAGITVIIASALGLPVSSTHIAVGGVFGVGFLREFISNRRMRPDIAYPDTTGVAEDASLSDESAADKLRRKEAKQLRRRLVRRQHLLTILAAWIVTLPCAAILSAGLFYLVHWIMR